MIESTLKIARYCGTLGDTGLLQFFRVISRDDKANPEYGFVYHTSTASCVFSLVSVLNLGRVYMVRHRWMQQHILLKSPGTVSCWHFQQQKKWNDLGTTWYDDYISCSLFNFWECAVITLSQVLSVSFSGTTNANAKIWSIGWLCVNLWPLTTGWFGGARFDCSNVFATVPFFDVFGMIVIFMFVSMLYLGSTPQPLTVTTRIIPFLVGNPYKPSFVNLWLLLGGG